MLGQNNLLKSIDMWITNFIWAGEVNSRKVCTVSWNTICSSFDERGLGLRTVKSINDAASLKLCWDLVTSNDQRSTFLKARFFKDGVLVSYHISSSVWTGIKSNLQTVNVNVTCFWDMVVQSTSG